jgi:hypothetical protein
LIFHLGKKLTTLINGFEQRPQRRVNCALRRRARTVAR